MVSSQTRPQSNSLKHPQEIIAQKVQAVNHVVVFTLTNLEKHFTITPKESVDTVDGKLANFAKNINLNTCGRMKESTKTLAYHACNMHDVVGTLVSCFQYFGNPQYSFVNLEKTIT